MGHVTLTTSLLWAVCHAYVLGLDEFYLCAKLADSSFSRSRDIFGGVKI